MPVHFPIPAIVLAGGRSSRMGEDKATISLNGQMLAISQAERLQTAGHAPVLINSSNKALGDDRFARVEDAIEGYQGPLSGILSGLLWLAREMPQATHLATVAIDTPFFPQDFADRLSRLVEDENTITMAMWRGKPEPAFALWPVSLAEPLRTWLEAGKERSIRAFAAQYDARYCEFAPVIGDGNPFFNINTPDDLKQAEKRSQKPFRPAIVGIAGWKNSGKTGLTVRLVAELTARGYKVSTIKHAHHDFDIDKVGADSFRHREAGAHEVTIVSGTRFAIMHELRGAPEPTFEDILARLAPCDIVVIEGYKREPVPKIEARRLESKNREPLAPTDPHIVAIAADHQVADTVLPVFDLDDTQAVADFVIRLTNLNG